MSRTNRSFSVVHTLALLAGLVPSVAFAQTFNETSDAEQLIPGTTTTGSGVLTRINGSFATGSDSDLYAIRIVNPAAFSATTVGLTVADTQFFLFDITGRGIVTNDDVAVGNRQSTITGALVPEPGVYYLLITTFDNDPTFNGSQIWVDFPYVGERAPDGPAANFPVNGYNGNTPLVGAAYGIDLTGAEYLSNTNVECWQQFNSEQLTAAGDGPRAMVSADFNLDGKIDVVICNELSSNVSLLRGNGDGTFQPATNFSTGSTPAQIATGDFNRDGRPDIVTSNFGSNNITVRFATSTGFTPPVTYPAGSNPIDVQTADLNRDGILDLVVANQSSANLSVLIGNAAGTFAAPVNYPVGGACFNLALADLDPDGLVDAYVGTASGIYVLRGGAGGTFTAPIQISANRARYVAVGDLNQDNRPEIVGVDDATNRLSVSYGLGGAAAFTAPSTYATQTGPSSVAFCDINRDGRRDLAVGHGISYATQFYLGTDNFRLVTTGFTGVGGPLEVSIMDVNADGYDDIVGPLYPSDSLFVATQSQMPAVPRIFSQPISQTYQTGQTAYFTVSLSPDLIPLSLRWRRNGVPMSNGFNVTGVSWTNLALYNVSMADNGDIFDCVITNACGSVTTVPVSLTVTPTCTADFNRDGNLSSQDFFDFITAFFAGCP